MELKKVLRRNKIRQGIRKSISGSKERPRLSVFRSNKQIYAQLIDDLSGATLVAASSKDGGIDGKLKKTEQAAAVGKILGGKALTAGISTVTFDRGGYLYHGRVKALAEGAREAGLNF